MRGKYLVQKKDKRTNNRFEITSYRDSEEEAFNSAKWIKEHTPEWEVRVKLPNGEYKYF